MIKKGIITLGKEVFMPVKVLIIWFLEVSGMQSTGYRTRRFLKVPLYLAISTSKYRSLSEIE
jgi:hypothetical protein